MGKVVGSWRVSRAFFVICLVFLGQWLLLFQVATPVWDEAFYYAYARSTVFDQDLRLENDFVQSYEFTPPFFAERAFEAVRTETGRVNSPFAIGTGILWVPLLVVLRLVVGLANVFQAGVVPATGYEWYFVGAVGALSALFGLLAFWIGYRVAEEGTDRRSALASTLTLMVATPLVFYQFRAPLMSHTASALATAVVIFLWQRGRGFSSREGLLLGGAIGFASLVRWQHLIYLALPAVSVVLGWLLLPAGRRKGWGKEAFLYLLPVGLMTVTIFSVQLSVWRIFYGHWIGIPQGEGFIDWRAVYVWPTLFSTYRGLIPWMPAAALAGVGLFLLGRERPRLAIPLIVVLLLAIYVNGSTPDWFAGGGYGPRRFTSELTIFVIGYAALLARLPRVVMIAASAVVGGLLAIHQAILLRFGIEEGIGGHHISWVPTSVWVEEAWPVFWQRIGAHVADLGQRPLEVLILENSPLDTLRAGGWPVQPVVALLAAVAFLGLVFAGTGWLLRRRQGFVPSRAYVTAAVATLIMAAHAWILLLA